MRMYQMQNFKLDDLKNLLWSEPVSEPPSKQDTLASRQNLWRDNVGLAEETLHWCDAGLIDDVERMLCEFSLDEIRACFARGKTAPNAMCSHLSNLCVGVMDLFFITSCFAFPVVQRMGPLFWMLAKTFILLDVHDADELNFLLWYKVLPQTVLCLKPCCYAIDSVMDPISVTLTIKGSRDENGDRSVLAIASHSSLWFLANIRIMTLRMERYETDIPGCPEFIVRFVGARNLRLKAELLNVSVLGGGIDASHFWTVVCNNVRIVDAICGLHVNSGNLLYVKNDRAEEPIDGPGLFLNCELAMYTRDVAHIGLIDLYFEKPLQVFEMHYTAACCIRDCTVEFFTENLLGIVLGPSPPMLDNLKVIQIQKSTKAFPTRYLTYTISDLTCSQFLAPIVTRHSEEA